MCVPASQNSTVKKTPMNVVMTSEEVYSIYMDVFPETCLQICSFNVRCPYALSICNILDIWPFPSGLKESVHCVRASIAVKSSVCSYIVNIRLVGMTTR